MYYLRLASRDPLLCGTPFEVLVQRLMDELQPAQSALWNDVLLTVPEEKPTDSLTTIEEDAIRKKAIELDQVSVKGEHVFGLKLSRKAGVRRTITKSILRSTRHLLLFRRATSSPPCR